MAESPSFTVEIENSTKVKYLKEKEELPLIGSDANIKTVNVVENIQQRPLVKKAFGENPSSSTQKHNIIDDSDNESIPEVSSNLQSRTFHKYQSEASHPFSIE